MIANDELVDRLRAALDSGSVTPAQVVALLDGEVTPTGNRHRSTPADVARAIGAAIALVGIVLAYALSFDDLARPFQLATPYAFPIVLGAITIAIDRRAGRVWVREFALATTCVATAAAIATSASVLDHDADVYVGVAAPMALVALLGGVRMLGRAHSLMWGISGASVAAIGAWASVLGVHDEELRWVLLPTAAVIAIVGIALLRRRWRPEAAIALGAATLVGITAATMGLSDQSQTAFSIWHLLLGGIAVGALLVGSAERLPTLTVTGVVASLLWIQSIAVLVHGSIGLALLLVGAGIAFALLPTLARRITGHARHGDGLAERPQR